MIHRRISRNQSRPYASPILHSIRLLSTPAQTNWICIVACVVFSSISLQPLTHQTFAAQPAAAESVDSPVSGSIWFDEDAGELIPVKVSNHRIDNRSIVRLAHARRTANRIGVAAGVGV